MGTNIKSMVIDDAPGQPFEAHFAAIIKGKELKPETSGFMNRTGKIQICLGRDQHWHQDLLQTHIYLEVQCLQARLVYSGQAKSIKKLQLSSDLCPSHGLLFLG